MESPRNREESRITSYNVCYTKLLRETDEYESHNLTYNQFYFGFKSALYSHKDLIIMSKAAYVHSNVSEQINDFSGTVSGMQIGIGILKQIVITSYSIHYTKLYDLSAKTSLTLFLNADA